MQSKENCVLELFFEEPTREWHFEEILHNAKITRSKGYYWLLKFTKQGLIKRIKPKNRMPYYQAEYASPPYQNHKKIFTLHELYDCGFLNHLSALQHARTVIIFGSYARSDWYKNSDIDIFIYGDANGLKIAPYELKLHTEIQVFIVSNLQELHKLGSNLIKNIIKGNLIKGDIDFVNVEPNA